MRINTINTMPIHNINGNRKKANAYINNQITFGISEHERRVKERQADLTKNMGWWDKNIFGGNSKARTEAERQIDAEDLAKDKELIRQVTINEETKKRVAEQAQYTAHISKLNQENSARMAALEQAQQQHIQWQKDVFAQTQRTNQMIMQQIENFANLMKEMQAMRAEADKVQGELLKQLLEARNTNNKAMEEEIRRMREELRKEFEAKYKAKTEETERTRKMEEMFQKMHETNSARGFGKVAGYQTEKDILLSQIGNSIIAERSGQPADIPNGILFYGPKGNGKSLFAKSFAEQLDCHNIKIELDLDIVKNWENLKSAAQKAKENFEKDGKRTIIRIEEFDDFAPKDSRIISPLKSFMDDASQKYHATIFATTNFPEKIDDILLRKGRFDVRVPLAPANKQDTIAIIKHYAQPFADETINYEKLSEEIVKVQPEKAFSNARIQSIIQGVIREVSDNVGSKNGCKISQKAILESIQKLGADISKNAMDLFLTQIKYMKNI